MNGEAGSVNSFARAMDEWVLGSIQSPKIICAFNFQSILVYADFSSGPPVLPSASKKGYLTFERHCDEFLRLEFVWFSAKSFE